MAVPAAQTEAAAFLRGLAGTEPVETHISLVFIGADTIWKLKKAVRLAFLDFTSVDDRRRFALRELELNSPAAPGLYRDVVPIVRRADGGLAFASSPATGLPVVDWVLRMARIPAEDFLDTVARAGRFTPALLDGLGDAVAAFHGALPPATGVAVAKTMRWIAEGNVASACDAGLPKAAVQAWFAGVSATLAGIGAWQEERARDGFVRRAHGDLHLGNLCLWHGRPVPFDALEFDERMATIDLGYDLAFLLMDLDQRVDRSAANRVLNRYVARTGDAALTRGLPAFLSVRAMVRAHVEASRGHAADAERYLREAATCLRPPPPVAVAIGGLPGSGKSTLARALAPELGGVPGALILRSDEIRKRLHHAAPEDRLPQAAYSDAANEAVLAALAAAMRAALDGGHAAVADATFMDAGSRAKVAEAAASARVPFLGLWLDAPLPVLEARIAARQRDASDATIDVLHAASRASVGFGDWIAVAAGAADAGANTALAQARKLLQSLHS